MTDAARSDTVAQALDLSAHVTDIEQRLSDLDAALVAGDPVVIEKWDSSCSAVWPIPGRVPPCCSCGARAPSVRN